ncbi:MAG: hypothetical protein R3338_14975 [Thermoanaerobaculia bacterium]|nr:hypothetical protein [Thermoanaerobaculia bacterium]
MAVRKSLRWSIDLSEPEDELRQTEKEERRELAWAVFLLLIAGIAITVWNTLEMLG